MSGRAIALVAGVLAIAAVCAQYANPAWPGYHEWSYATALVVLLVLVGTYASGALRGRDGDVGSRLAIAAAGTFVVAIAGLASGLLGPDTETVQRAPGTVAPLPDVGAAAFFPSADGAAVAAGRGDVVVRRRDGSEQTIPARGTRIVGSSALELVPERAAFVEARDAAGRRLTVTQPTNVAFLSPILFFPSTVDVAGHVVPADTFAVPAVHRQVRTLVFDRLQGGHAPAGTSGPAMLFAVDDDRGRPLPGGIGFGASGRDVRLGGLAIRATLGTYPALLVSSVPSPLATGAGLAIALGGGVAAFLASRAGTRRKPLPTPSPADV